MPPSAVQYEIDLPSPRAGESGGGKGGGRGGRGKKDGSQEEEESGRSRGTHTRRRLLLLLLAAPTLSLSAGGPPRATPQRQPIRRRTSQQQQQRRTTITTVPRPSGETSETSSHSSPPIHQARAPASPSPLSPLSPTTPPAATTDDATARAFRILSSPPPTTTLQPIADQSLFREGTRGHDMSRAILLNRKQGKDVIAIGGVGGFLSRHRVSQQQQHTLVPPQLLFPVVLTSPLGPAATGHLQSCFPDRGWTTTPLFDCPGNLYKLSQPPPVRRLL